MWSVYIAQPLAKAYLSGESVHDNSQPLMQSRLPVHQAVGQRVIRPVPLVACPKIHRVGSHIAPYSVELFHRAGHVPSGGDKQPWLLTFVAQEFDNFKGILVGAARTAFNNDAAHVHTLCS